MATCIDLSTFITRRDAGELVVDVREPAEYEAGHVPGAVPLPLDRVAAEGGTLPKDTPLLVICRSGARSRTGADELTRLGYTARSVDGGTNAWIAAGHPVVTGSNPN